MCILADKLGITTGPLAWIGGLDLNHVGYAIVGLFVLTWVVALAVWRFGRIEERWSRHLAPTPDSHADPAFRLRQTRRRPGASCVRPAAGARGSTSGVGACRGAGPRPAPAS